MPAPTVVTTVVVVIKLWHRRPQERSWVMSSNVYRCSWEVWNIVPHQFIVLAELSVEIGMSILCIV